MELVVKALCGCSAMDIVSILKKQRQTFDGIEITADAQRSDATPSGIRLDTHDICIPRRHPQSSTGHEGSEFVG